MASSILTTTELDFQNGGTQAKMTATADTLTFEGTALGTCMLTGLTLCVSDTDAANKEYVDSVAVGLFWKAPARLASTGDVDIATELEAGDTIDGQVLVAGDRVLLKDQTLPVENGIYVAVGAGAASRSDDLATGSDADGAAIFVKEGTANADTAWVQVSSPAIVGTDALSFVQFSNVTASPGGLNTQVQYNNAGSFGGISGITTNGTTTMSWGDTAQAIFGTGGDLTITHDGSNSTVTNITGDLQLVSTAVTGSIENILGTATSATTFEVQDSTNAPLLIIDGAGDATFTGTLMNIGVEGTTYTIQGETATTAATAGTNVLLTAGGGGPADGAGGGVSITAGDGGAADGDGGDIQLEAGAESGVGTPGTITFTSGDDADTTVGFTFEGKAGTDVVTIKSGSQNSTSVTTGTLVVTGGAGFSQDCYATQYFAVSDVRLKKNITGIDSPLEKIMSMRGYEYDWIDDSNPGDPDKRQLGVIAQQLEEIGMGNLVNGTDKQKAVNYLAIIPLLIEAIKELARKI